jgi:amidohydrolase
MTATDPGAVTAQALEKHGSPASVIDQARGVFDDTVTLRRKLHRNPELGNDLPITRKILLDALADLPLDITLHTTTSGIVATLEGDKPGDTVLLRGDMDALPLREDTGLDFESGIEGVMHACGHDTHVSMLVGAARMLSERRSDINGRVMFMFQPGEEGFGGAQFMIDEGMLADNKRKDGSDSPVTGAYALHITSSMPTGWFATKAGPIMASSDDIHIKVIGRGGHGSEPFRALDPIPIACEIVQAFQTMVTRQINPFDPTVVSVCAIKAGTASNVIPEFAEIDGTIRAISEATRVKVHDLVKQVAEGVAAAHGADIEVTIRRDYPVTQNDASKADFMAELATTITGADNVFQLPNPVMGAEDFSFVLNKLPGAMMFLGATPRDKDFTKSAPNHSNRVFFEEEAMLNGMALYATAALRHLGAPLS